jgi:hypothetical protein
MERKKGMRGERKRREEWKEMRKERDEESNENKVTLESRLQFSIFMKSIEAHYFHASPRIMNG